MLTVFQAPFAADRLVRARDFLATIPQGTEVAVVSEYRAAADDLVRQVSLATAATFGMHRFSFTQLAVRLAAPTVGAQKHCLDDCARHRGAVGTRTPPALRSMEEQLVGLSQTPAGAA